MPNLIEFTTDSELPVFIEMDDHEGIDGGEIEISAKNAMKGVVGTARDSFSSALETINTVSASVIKKISQSSKKPDELTVEFGVKFSANAGAFLAKAGTDAHLTVKMTWKDT